MSGEVFGRQAELEAVEHSLDLLADGPTALVVEGQPGIGKTTVWREAVRRAEERGYRVLRTRPAEAEAKLSFSGLADLLREIEDLGHLPEPQRYALEVALLRTEKGTADRRAVFAGVVSVLLDLVSEGPVVVAVDDVQWLDTPSAAALEFALRRLGIAPVGVLASVRIADEPPPIAFDRALDEAHVRRLRLGPLSLGAVHHLLKSRLGRSFPKPTLVKVIEAGGGNPFFALEIARELIQRGEVAPGQALPVPDDVRDLVRARIRRLSAGGRTALLAAAALARPTAQFLDDRALAEAEEADLVRIGADGRVRFSHPLFASAVYEAATAERRRDVHHRLASLVEDPEERARHLALSSDGPDPGVAGELSEAATVARSRGAPDAAAELEELAIRLEPADSDDLPLRMLMLADHLYTAGENARSTAVVVEMLEKEPSGDLKARALLLLAVLSYLEADFVGAIRHAERSVLEAQSAQLVAEAHKTLSWMNRDPRLVMHHAKAALELLDAEENPEAYSQSLFNVCWGGLVHGYPPDVAGFERAMALQRNLDLGGSEGGTGVLYWPAAKDDFDQARSVCRNFLERAQRAGREVDLAFGTAMLAEIGSWTGEWEMAVEEATNAAEAAELIGSEFVFDFALSTKARLEAHLGRVDSVRQALAAARTPDERWSYAAGVLELSLGNHREADSHFARVAAELEAEGIREPVRHRFAGDHIEAVVALGELDRAEALLERLEERARTFPRPWVLAVAARCRGLVLGARGRTDEALAALDEALVHHERLEMPFELARTLLVKGQLHRRERQKRLAGEALERALAIVEELGAPLWAERTRSELARVRGRRGPEELTEGELKVAELAAGGQTNREIASALFMSPKTVEKRLAAAYLKLGIRSRGELGARMAERRSRAKA